jgi:hypothetical protein
MYAGGGTDVALAIQHRTIAAQLHQNRLFRVIIRRDG